MNRIKSSDLTAIVKLINLRMGSPLTPWTQENGKLTGNIGNYHLSGAYGGVSLHRTVNAGGGVSDVFRCGHVTKRDLYNRMRAFLEGIDTTQAKGYGKIKSRTGGE